MKKFTRLLALAAVLAMVAVACGTEASPPADESATPTTMEMADDTMTDDSMDMSEGTMADEMHEDDEAGHDEHTFAFGEPADAADADRVIEIETSDELRFEPASFDVQVGEVITFRVSNNGNLPHDFTLDDAEGQDVHEAEMAEMAADGMMMMGDEPNGFGLPAGETKELTWHFTEAGEVLIGCHQPGHYAAGMVATVNVSS